MMTLNLRKMFANFKSDESGAVTVDWVVLTAAIVGLGLVVMQTVGDGVVSLGTDIAGEVSGTTVGFTATAP